MASSKGLITTAGFESVCEALFLGKPVMMVPVEHHFEQWCNSHDALNAGAGIRSDSFSITKIVEYHTHHTSKTEAFIAWYGTKEKTIFQAFEEVLHQSMEPSTSEHLIRGTASGTQLQPGI
jgi:UDP-N-acetylglucosamine:LPS N-acetylglucosamine transferase